MPTLSPAIQEYLSTHQTQFEEVLRDFLRIASVSSDPAHRDDMVRAAQWVADQFRALGFEPTVVPTAGHPLVLAQSPIDPKRPTVLVYGHYDVQPAEPLDLWESPPFEPTVRDGKLYARGATDDKGQLLTHLLSTQAFVATGATLPVNLKFVIEGEEEVGSAGLQQFLAERKEELACDCVVISDGAQFGPGQPAITYGLRGIAYFEVRLTGPNRDLHSGSFGGTLTNPANALAAMLAALVDQRGRIRIPGFYRTVRRLTRRQRKLLAELPFDEARYFAQLGVSEGAGEQGYTTLERRWARPTFDICGLWAGYQGTGAKTIIPSSAGAKISFRLVPNQDPHQVGQALRAMLSELCPPGIQLHVEDLHGSPAVLMSLGSPYIRAAARAIEHAFGCAPVYTREGGSIPIVTALRQSLGVDILLVGWGQDDDNAHSPNEKFLLADFHRGIRASAALWEELGRVGKRRASTRRRPAAGQTPSSSQAPQPEQAPPTEDRQDGTGFQSGRA